MCAARSEPSSGLERSGLNVGVAYEPLRRLWPYLGREFAGELAGESPWAASQDGRVRIIDRPDQARPVVAELAALIPSAASRVEERLTSIEALLDAVRPQRLHEAALLASTGRFDEAGEALAQFVPVPGGPSRRRIEERHTIEQLRRWIQTRDPSTLAPAPDLPPPADPPDPRLRDRLPVVIRAALRHLKR